MAPALGPLGGVPSAALPGVAAAGAAAADKGGVSGSSSTLLLNAFSAMANACCDGGCIEVLPDGRLLRMVSTVAYGYSEQQMEAGRSILAMCFEDDRQPLLQTFRALAATAASTSGSGNSGVSSLRVLHRMLFWIAAEGRTKTTWVDTIVNACSNEGAHTMLLSSRCALPGTAGAENGGIFRVFPVGPNNGA